MINFKKICFDCNYSTEGNLCKCKKNKDADFLLKEISRLMEKVRLFDRAHENRIKEIDKLIGENQQLRKEFQEILEEKERLKK